MGRSLVVFFGAIGAFFAAVAPSHARARTASGSRGASGSLGDRTAFYYYRRTLGSGRETREWLALVVLWRLPAGTLSLPPVVPYDSAANVAAERRLRVMRDAAEDSSRQFIGGRYGPIAYGAAVSRRDLGTLWVAKRAFTIPERDSALVLMLDATNPNSDALKPRIIGSAYINANLPDAAWSKSWTSASGDPRVPRRRALGAHDRSPQIFAD